MEGGVGRGRVGEGCCAGIGTPLIIGVTLSRLGGGGGSPAGDNSKNAWFSSAHCPKRVTYVWSSGMASMGMGVEVVND